MAPTIEDIEEEQRHFANVISAFKHYAQYTLSSNNRRRKDLYTLPKADQEILDTLGYKQKLEEVDKAILVNADFLAQIVSEPQIFGHDLEEDEEEEHGSNPDPTNFPHSTTHSHSHSHSRLHSDRQHHHGRHDGRPNRRKKYTPTEFDMDKLRSTLKQLVRDWSEEGKEEREACYKPMKDALEQHFANVTSPEARRKLKVLVPGAGLGRLAYDVAKLGFACQGNEFSHYMLLTSFFILNKTTEIKKHTFYPYVHSFSNAPNKQSILQAISIPDVSPSDLPPGSDFSLVAGDFEEIFGDPEEPRFEEWDAIMTCFFIDTAKNIVNYLRLLHRILAPGGVWINLGPLLWHWENNNTSDPSVELDLEELKSLARTVGFEISNERTIDTTYTNNAQSMLGYVYHASFFTATKIKVN
ncbi:hypothetical protein M413DRAFT_27609 [Hebeloma cylindrosporum]|uniref:carnosine N-methyltransferase n=1 Tax=Hebeloma cylindrosporum TaxID=76867 RepID=A0A0C2YJL4_HEBCY|nr:hypothetical protein M413DRAFT_27609 [Hebeloma cylindrosporum h7]